MWPSLASGAIALIIRIWDLISGAARNRLLEKRRELEKNSRQAQIDGDLDDLRTIRAEIEEIDRKLRNSDY